jgi:hypothetical protein
LIWSRIRRFGKPRLARREALGKAPRIAQKEVQAMRNILAFLGALVVTLLVVGWYENWFQVRTTPGKDGNRNISIDIDSSKVTNDVEEAEHKIETVIEEEAKKAKSTQSAKDKPPVGEEKDTSKDSKFELKFFGPLDKN